MTPALPPGTALIIKKCAVSSEGPAVVQRPYHRDTRLLQPAEQLPDMQVIAVKVVQLDQIGPVRFHPPQQAAGGSGRTEAVPVGQPGAQHMGIYRAGGTDGNAPAPGRSLSPAKGQGALMTPAAQRLVNARSQAACASRSAHHVDLPDVHLFPVPSSASVSCRISSSNRSINCRRVKCSSKYRRPFRPFSR